MCNFTAMDCYLFGQATHYDIYKKMGAHLAAVSYTHLGALVAGFVAGYIVNLLKKICSKLPESLDGVKPVLLYPLLGIFLIGVIMQFVVEPPIGALNTAINNRCV